MINMSDYLDVDKKIVFTYHFTVKWADRIAASGTVAQAFREAQVIEKISGILRARKYKTVLDGEEFNGKKYRLICDIFGEVVTFVVIDTQQALVFKSVWKSKDWEKKYLKEMKS